MLYRRLRQDMLRYYLQVANQQEDRHLKAIRFFSGIWDKPVVEGKGVEPVFKSTKPPVPIVIFISPHLVIPFSSFRNPR